MKITEAQFITSAKGIKFAPEKKLPEIAISGRSNVGKSSLINYIMNRKKLAKTSSSPGKTRFLNYFLINNLFYIVDLPGYGYSKVSKTEKEEWKSFIEEYFSENQNLKLVLQLIDIRHPIKENDQLMLEYLQYNKLPFIIILTKSDKLNQSEKTKKLNYFCELFPDIRIISSSSEKKQGKDKILSEMFGSL